MLLQRDWGKGVHCGNVTVKNKANRFSFQKADLPIFIRNYSRSYYSPDLKTVSTFLLVFVSLGLKIGRNASHIVSLLAEGPLLLKKLNLFGF